MKVAAEVHAEALAKTVYELAPAWLVLLVVPISARVAGLVFPWGPLLILLALPPAIALLSAAVRLAVTAVRGAQPSSAERASVRVDLLARRHGVASAGRLWLSDRGLVFAASRTNVLCIPLHTIVSIEARGVGSIASLVWFRPEAFPVVIQTVAGQVHRFDVAAPVSLVAAVRAELARSGGGCVTVGG